VGGKSIQELIHAVPEIVTGRYIVNASFDSGPLSLSAEEKQAGWKNLESLALSPKITSVRQVPYHQYDERYIFENPPLESMLEDIEVFINFGGFSLIGEFVDEIQKRFWLQMMRLKPESYLAEGDNLIFVTKNRDIFRRISSA
jgi:hypothetical protein